MERSGSAVPPKEGRGGAVLVCKGKEEWVSGGVNGAEGNEGAMAAGLRVGLSLG